MDIAQWYAHLNDDGRIDGIMPGLLDDGRPNVTEGDLALGWEPWPFEGDPPEDFAEWRIEGGALAHSPLGPTDEELHARAVAAAIEGLPEALADTDAALCESYEDAQARLADLEAAICEIYELVIGE